MGGNVPLGYRVEARKLVVIEEEAARVRLIFQRYLDLGSLGRLLVFLREAGIVTKTLIRNGVVARGGIPFTRGALAYLLRNRFYVGEIVFQGAVHPAEHQAIVTRELFEAVQVKLTAQRNGQAAIRAASGALLAGLLFDDRGHRMAPSCARKGGRRYGYYISRALIDGRPLEAGSVRRISAPAIEEQVLRALRRLRPEDDGIEIDPISSIRSITLHPDRLVITLRDCEGSSRQDHRIDVPWQRPAFRRVREIIAVPDRAPSSRPMRIETRETLLRAIAKSRRWAAEITTGAVDSPDAIAIREGCSRRQVNATLTLAGLAPNIVEAAIAGKLPHGIALRDLTDAPLAWQEQHCRFGLSAP